MKKARKVLSLLFACVFAVSFFPATAFAAGEDWQYTENGDEITITGYTGAEKDITIPSLLNGKNVTAIGSDVFTDDAITNITIPESVTTIDSGVFWECRTLESIRFTGNNPNYKSDNGIAFSKDGSVLFHYPANKSGAAYTVPAGVTTIGRCAFDHNQQLQSVTLTDGVSRIEDCAFWRCEALASFNIPKSVSYIGESVFSNSGRMAGITVAAGNTQFKSVGGVLFNITGRLLKQYPCGKSGSSYTVPGGVTAIGGGAFRGANGLTEVILSDSVAEISATAFAFCESLASVRLGSGVTSIRGMAFQCCFSLQSIVIPQSVKTVENMAFDSCEALKDVYFLGAMPAFGGNVFQNTAAGFVVHYYKGYEDRWQSYSDYAKKAFCYVTFESSGGSKVAAQMADYGGKIQKPSAPSKANFDFAGWYKDPALKNAWIFETNTIAADTTLYAKWTPKIYTVKFSTNKGGTIPEQKIPYGGKAVKPRDPVRVGCTFAGWYKDSLFKTAWSFTSNTVTGNTTLYAKWKSNGTYTIKTAVDIARSGRTTGAGSYKGGDTVKLMAIPSDGYRFVKWMEGKKTVSKNVVYTFDAEKSRSLKAYFEKIGIPRILSASLAGSDSIKVKWSPVTGAASYSVYRSTSKSGTYKEIATVKNAAAYTDKGLTKGRIYYYKVRANCTAAGKTTFGSRSSEKSATVPPPAVTGLAVIKKAQNTAVISYAPVTGAAGYEICRSAKKSSSYGVIKTTTALKFTNTSLIKGKTYYYKVRAFVIISGKKIYGGYSDVQWIRM